MKPNRNIPIEISVLAIDIEKQRLQVSFYGDVNEVTFVNKQRIQFFDPQEESHVYVGTYKVFNGTYYIEDIQSNVENFFENITTASTFTTYDYSYFWLPNQENFLTLKMVYDFFKDKSYPNETRLSYDNSIESYDDEDSMVGFIRTFDKWKIDNSKVYVQSGDSYSPNTQRVFNIRVNNYKQFDIILFGDNCVCQMDCCFSSSNDLSIVFVHNNFNENITINALKLVNEDETYIQLTIVGDETNACIVGIVNVEDIFSNIDISEFSTEVITFDDGSETVEITPKVFKIDKQRILSFEDSSNGAIEIEQGTDLKNLLKSGEYYCVNNIDIVNKPDEVTNEFTLLCYGNGYEQRPTRYQMNDSNGDIYVGKYNNGSIEWKKVLNELPEHTHDPEDINTNNSYQFISQEDRDRWNHNVSGTCIWGISQNIVSPEQNRWNIDQVILKKEYLYVSADLDLVINSINDAGVQGLVVLKNLSDDSIDISLYFSRVSVLMLGVDTNLTANGTTITVPTSKALEIYYMRLDANNMVCKARLLNVINLSSQDYRVVGEENDLVIPSI